VSEGADSGPFPCVCCGYLVLAEGPGSHEICPVCRWEDDLVQLRWPAYDGGANGPSLVEAQRTYAELGASTEARVAHARGPAEAEVREPDWRPVDPELDDFEQPGVSERPWPDDRRVLYWWRQSFWRRGRGPVTGGG
jgi:hypothetical protein